MLYAFIRGLMMKLERSEVFRSRSRHGYMSRQAMYLSGLELENVVNNHLAFCKIEELAERYRQVMKKNRPCGPWWWEHKPRLPGDDLFKLLAETSVHDKSIYGAEGSETYKA
jgi:hypothetical protein